MHSLSNLFALVRILRERGNWRLIRHSQKSFLDFLLCRTELNRKSIFCAVPYWLWMLKGLDVLIWRLETFGFLYLPGMTGEQKDRLNRYLPKC